MVRDGRRSGRVMRRNWCHGPAPSVCAASYSSRGMACRPAASQEGRRCQAEAEFQAQSQAGDGQGVHDGVVELIVRSDSTQGPETPVPRVITEAEQQRGDDWHQREGSQIEYKGYQAPEV